MLPSFIVCGAVSIVLLTGRWFIAEADNLVERIGVLVLFGLIWGMWIIQSLGWIYRGATYMYRLTPRWLFIDRGFLWKPEPAIELDKVSQVVSGGDRLGRWFGVGWVEIRAGNQEVRRLYGILKPEAFATKIRETIRAIKSS